MKTFNTIIIAAVLSGFGAASVNAQATALQVSYAGLDLSTASGKAALASRIEAAAEAVCDVNVGTTSLSEAASAERCRAETVAVATKAVALKTAPVYASR